MSTPALPEDSGPALTEFQRLLYTFTAPAKTMTDLRRNASWWVPWLLVSIISVGFTYTLDKKIGWAQAIETQIQANPKAAAQIEQQTPGQREKTLKTQAAVASVIGYAAPLMTLLALVMLAGVLLGIFNFGFGARLRFGELMGVAAYSLLPSILNTLLIITVMFLVPPDAFDVKNPIATNIGYFVPNTMPFLKTLLGALDVFTLWQVFLLAVGVSQLSKVKKGTAFATIFALFFMVRLVSAGFGGM
jgi:hypothetical protein